MKYTIFRRALCGAIMGTMLTITAGAVTIDSIKVDIASDNAEISGTSDTASEKVIMQLFYTEETKYSPIDYFTASAEVIQNSLVRMWQTHATEGNYEFAYKISEASAKEGQYTLRIAGENGGFTSKTFYYYNSETVDAVRNELNAAIASGDAKSLAALIEKYENMLTAEYEPLRDTVVKGYTTEMARLLITEAKFTDNASMTAAVQKNATITMLKNAKDADTVADLLNLYGENLEFDDKTAYEAYKGFSQPEKLATAARLQKSVGTFSNQAAFYKALDSAVMITEIEQVNGPDAVKRIVEKYKKYFDLSKAKTENYRAVAAASKAGTLSSIESIQTLLSASSDDSGKNGGSSGGGSGSSGGGKGISSAKIEATNQSVDMSEKDLVLAGQYKDLEQAEWAREAIVYLSQKGVLNGYDQDTFAPMEQVTRAQLCKMLCLAFEMHSDSPGTEYQDVPRSSWFWEPINILTALGVAQGMENNLFCPDEYISREDMAVLAHRLWKLRGGVYDSAAAELQFGDAGDISDYAKDAITELTAMQVLRGDENGNVMPKSSATRAEAAKFVYGLLEYTGGVSK